MGDNMKGSFWMTRWKVMGCILEMMAGSTMGSSRMANSMGKGNLVIMGL